MTAMTASQYREGGMTSEERMVIFASSLGTVFEWYDFYIYGTLAPILAAQFFSGVNPTAAFIFTLLAFAAGFAVRPFGALFFGRLGDIIGRKYTFLITMSLMGVGTFFIGLLPSYASAGIVAPIMLIGLRLVQGLALGGEYGGAAIYVAEHAPKNKRGFYTSWIQTTATLGLFMALLLVLGIRSAQGEPAFAAWGWRIPFLLSAILLAVSIWIRLKLNELPVFQRMKARKRVQAAADGGVRRMVEPQDRDPGAVRRHRRRSRRVVWRAILRAVLPDTDAEGARVHCADHDRDRAAARHAVLHHLRMASDKIGRKPIIMAGFALAAMTYFPIFQGLTHFANPTLETHGISPVTVIADPANARSSSIRSASPSSPPRATSPSRRWSPVR